MEVSSFAEIETEFIERVHHMVWCNVATIDTLDRPRFYVDCKAEWIDDLDQKQRVWQLCKETPPPVGFDPAPIYERFDHPNFGVLKLIPWRIELYNPPPDKPLVWHP